MALLLDDSKNPLILYHGTALQLDHLDPRRTADGGLHFGNRDQAMMRNSAFLYEVNLDLDLDQNSIRRSKDRGGDWKKRISEARHKGFKGIVYLNRYEGISQETVLSALADGIDLDRLTDREFRKRVPEAKDSWIVFSIEQVRVLNVTTKFADNKKIARAP